MHCCNMQFEVALEFCFVFTFFTVMTIFIRMDN